VRAFSLQWSRLNLSSKVSTVLGFAGGELGALLGFGIGGPAFLLLFLVPIVSLVSSVWLLFFPATNERRGILSFVSLTCSIPGTYLLALILLRLEVPHRDAPTGL